MQRVPFAPVVVGGAQPRLLLNHLAFSGISTTRQRRLLTAVGFHQRRAVSGATVLSSSVPSAVRCGARPCRYGVLEAVFTAATTTVLSIIAC